MDAWNGAFLVDGMTDTDRPPHPNKNRPSAAYVQGFFDDSGKDSKSPIYAIAGYLGMPSSIATFSKAWGRMMNRKPRFPYWHTHTARKLKYDDKYGIDAAAVEAREYMIAELLIKHSGPLCAISVEVDKQLFKSFESKLTPKPGKLSLSPKELVVLSQPFYVLFHHVIIGATITARRMGPRLDGFQLFMEDAEGEDWQDQVCFALRAFRRAATPEYRKALASVTFAPGKGRVTLPALEAADLFAWHVRNRAMNPDVTGHIQHVRLLLEGVRGAKTNRVVLTEQHLEGYAAWVRETRNVYTPTVELDRGA